MSSEEEAVGETTGPSWSLIGAALVVGVVVAMGVVLSIQGLRGEDDAEEPPTSAATSQSSASPSTTTASVCGLPGRETAGTVNRAPTAEWALVDGFAVPSVKSAGPGKVEGDGFRFCYAQTREGALTAAANFVGVSGDPELAKKVTDKLIAPGPGREVARRSAAGTSGTGSDGPRVQVAGFKMVSYSAESSTVEILLRGSNGEYVVQQLPLRWTEGDWRLELADNGGPLAEPRSVPSAAGYVEWSGA